MTTLIITAAGVLLLPSVGVGIAVLIAYARDRHRDRRWATDFDAWEVDQ